MEATHPDVQKLADAVKAFCDCWFRNQEHRRLLVISGPTGCGKTHAMRRCVGWARAVGYERWLRLRSSGNSLPEVSLFQWSNVANPQRMTEERFHEWRLEAQDVSLLAIDDIGTEADVFKSGIPTSRLSEVLNYREGKFTIITTNVPAAGWVSRWDARVEDRLQRDSVVLELSAPSFVNFS